MTHAVKRAMLLAAGRGERMRPLTDTTAKPLLKVNGRSLIDYHLVKLASAGVTDVVINTSWRAENITSTLGDGSTYGLHIEYSHEPTALETAGGIRNALHLLGDDSFLVISADVWCDIDYGALLSCPLSAAANLLMVQNPPHNPDGDFIIDAATRLRLKNDATRGTGPEPTIHTYSGIGLYHSSMFSTLPVAPCPLRDVLIPAITAGQVTATLHSGLWFDVGTVERLKSLDDLLST